jgi:hypothetical protein
MTQIAERGGTQVSNRKMVVVGAVLVSVVAFAAGPILFAPSADLPQPSSAQLPFFVVLAATEAAVLGIAIAFAFLGRGAVRRLFTTSARATAVHVAVVWALGSWWLHDNLHFANGANLTGLLAIEYAFHMTLIAAAALVAWAFVAESRDRRA